MTKSAITRAVDACIAGLCRKFYSEPTLFYTENDLICRLYTLLLGRLPETSFPDREGNLSLIVHTEYPTPFKCDMHEDSFRVLPDNAKGHRRGHYDLVVLNPQVIKDFPYEDVKCQDYEPNGKRLKSWSEVHGPVIQYGVEFNYKRDAMSYRKATDRFGTADNRIASIVQDYKKLRAAVDMRFMEKAKAILFIRKCGPEALDHMRNKLARYESIEVQDSIQCRRTE